MCESGSAFGLHCFTRSYIVRGIDGILKCLQDVDATRLNDPESFASLLTCDGVRVTSSELGLHAPLHVNDQSATLQHLQNGEGDISSDGTDRAFTQR